jgi:hypothetical protein
VSNWFKKARFKGQTSPTMDDYAKGERPGTENHIKNPDGLTTPKGEFGGNERPGYPKGFSQNPENSDDEQTAKLHGRIPGESVLMDDGGDSHEGLGDRFVAQDEFNTDNDRIPLREKKLDNVDVGPHNMQKGNIFNRIKDRIKTRGIKL